MYIFALDTTLSKDDLSRHYRKMADIYGRSMLKASLILGWRPILSENQIIDSNLLLNEVANEQKFIELIEKGFIRISFFTKAKTYREVLKNNLNRPHWISSAWANADRNNLSNFLKTCGPMNLSMWGDEIYKQYEALTTIDSLRKEKNLIRAHPTKLKFLGRISNFYTDLPKHIHNDFKPVAFNVQKILKDIKDFLSKEKLNDRSAWLTILLSELFQATHSNNLENGAFETAYLAIIRAYNEVVCDSVSGGFGLRSVAFAPLPKGEKNLIAEMLTSFDQPHHREYVDIEKGLSGIPINTNIPNRTARNIHVLDRVSWHSIYKTITSPKYKMFLSDAKKNPKTRKAFLQWLSQELSIQVATEYVEAREPIIRIGSKALIVTAGIMFQEILILDYLLNLFGTRTFSDFVSDKLGNLAKKEINWRVNGSFKKALHKLTSIE